MATATGTDAGHHADGVLKHHFDDMEQQNRAARQGMWLFLVTEVMFFGGLFAAYTAYRLWYPYEFAAASSKLNVLIAGINSLVLLTSSLTMTLAITAARKGNRKGLVQLLLVTAALGVVFLGFKAVEYTADVQERLVPGGKYFDPTPFTELTPPAAPARVQLFLMFYYVMTGLHVLHLVIGIGVILYMAAKAYLGWIPPAGYVAIEVTSLYWHFVDLMWLFLVPLLYLAGHHDPEHLHIPNIFAGGGH